MHIFSFCIPNKTFISPSLWTRFLLIAKFYVGCFPFSNLSILFYSLPAFFSPCGKICFILVFATWCVKMSSPTSLTNWHLKKFNYDALYTIFSVFLMHGFIMLLGTVDLYCLSNWETVRHHLFKHYLSPILSFSRILTAYALDGTEFLPKQ